MDIAQFHEEMRALLDILIASVLCGVVGIEREISRKPAGFRTHMIIGAASALLIIMGKILVVNFHNEVALSKMIQTDPIRVIQAIIIGISFIGAGTILKSEKHRRVQYLTTAASILFAAGIGISIALQHYVIAVGVTVLILFINYFAHIIDKLIDKYNKTDNDKTKNDL